jgi:transposase
MAGLPEATHSVGREADVDVLVERCAGLDVHRDTVVATVRVPATAKGRPRREQFTRTFATTTAGITALGDWLGEHRITRVGMESTGVYWKPVFYLLEETVECWLLNAGHLKKVPGRKSDVTDAQWIAQLLECGLVSASFVPPRPVRHLRDLTRYRTSLTRDRTREVQRLQDVLEDAGIKLGTVASDVMGVSGRRMLAALIAGERDPEKLADLAYGKLRRKVPELEEALVGRFSSHHGFLCQTMLGRIDDIDRALERVEAQLEAQLKAESASFRLIRARLQTIPGVGKTTAEVIIAETGADMSRFPTPQQLCSWAGMCPGNNESAGRHGSTKTRKANVWLRGALGIAASSAARTHDTYLAARYHRLVRHRGKPRALVAVGHSILEAAWHIMANGVDYHDLGADHFAHTGNPERRAQRLSNQLRTMGYRVTLEKEAAA